MLQERVRSSIEAEFQPESVLEVLRNPDMLPKWARGFADAVETESEEIWVVTKQEVMSRIQVDISLERQEISYNRLGTAELIPGGLVKVLHRIGGGSVIEMSIPVAPPSSPDQVRDILEEELTALAMLVSATEGRHDASEMK